MGVRPGLKHSLLTAILLAGCGQDLQNGRYLLAVDGPIGQDTCRRLPADGTLPDGLLVTTGEEVHFDFAWLATASRAPMVGRFRRPVSGEAEGFSVAGSYSGVDLTIGEANCTISFAQVQIDAKLDGDRGTAFRGGLTVRETFVAGRDPRCPLRCDVVAPFRAELAP